MIIVIPISQSDLSRLPMHLKVLKKLGGLSGHKIVFSAVKSCASQAYAAAAEINDICGSTKVITMDSDPEGGWPFAPNKHFHFTATEMAHQSEPWLWMELDCYPVVPNWADAIASNYVANQKAVMGAVVTTPFRDDAGNIVVQEDDTMVCGCAVYPAWLAQHSVLIGNLMKPTLTQPWDVHMRHELRALGVAGSPLFGDFWNTQNYKWDGQQFSCEPAPTKFTARARGGVVPREVVLIHGCKDESLPALVLAGTERAVSVAPRLIAPLADGDDTQEMDRLRAAIERLEMRVTDADREVNRLSAENQELRMTLMQRKPDPQPEQPPVTDITPESILALIPEGKKLTLKSIAREFKVDPPTIEAVIFANPTKFVGPLGPAQWVGANVQDQERGGDCNGTFKERLT